MTACTKYPPLESLAEFCTAFSTVDSSAHPGTESVRDLQATQSVPAYGSMPLDAAAHQSIRKRGAITTPTRTPQRLRHCISDPERSAHLLHPSHYSAGTHYEKKRKLIARRLVTPAVYPRLVESLHFDIQSTGQKSHRVIISRNHRDALF